MQSSNPLTRRLWQRESVCVHVCVRFGFFIYARLLTLAHELAVERVKALRRQPSYVTFSRGCFSMEWDSNVRTYTHKHNTHRAGRLDARVIPVAE